MRKVLFHEGGKLTCPFLKLFSNINAGDIRYLHLDRLYFFNNTPYYIMAGHGEIDITQLPNIKPRFDKIEIANLDYYLQNREHKSLDYDEQAQIESFVHISFINETYNKPLLYTKEYKELEKALYGVQDYSLSIKPY